MYKSNNKTMKETMTEHLRSLGVGTETTLACRNGTHCESVRSMCYRIPMVYIDQRGKKYTCVINYEESTIKIKVTEREYYGE